MFKLSYKELRDNAFISAMAKLTNCSEYKDIKTSYNVMRMGKTLEEKLKESQKEWIEMADKLIKRDDKGNFAHTNNDFVWKHGVSADEGHKTIEDFLKKEIIIDRYKLKLEDMAPAKLSPNELAAIEPVFTELQAV